ncbi:MAG TPA: ABC-type transport auxiliary lipoprotein family protein [Steroidobacteraceae bacterium]|jgi:ABC-type uncharacterized transport system auxiliary subunit|nr:ABC-type transport auxiliary lipoprotein family protein [Steroidobacteraceae bacterium]
MKPAPAVRLPHLAALLPGGCAALLLSGCSGLLHSSAPPEQTYYLRAPAVAGTAAPGTDAAGTDAAGTDAASVHSSGVSLRVGHPVADPGLDSPRIMLVQADHRMNFYSGSRWPAPAPDLIESLAVQTLRASGDWSSVESSGSPFPSDYLLQIALRRFEADYTGGGTAPVVHVVLDCIVGRREGRDVIATFVAQGDAAAASNRLGAVVGAFEQASGTALSLLGRQTEQAVRTQLQHAPQNGENPVPSMRR